MVKEGKFDVNIFLQGFHEKYLGKNIFLFSLGMLIQAFAFNLFFSNYDIVCGGSSGLALILSKFIPVDLSLIVFVICLVLLLMGLIFFGFEYAVKMLMFTFLYPFFVSSTTLITRLIDLEDTSLFLIMIVGGGLMGLSSGLIRKSGYSPGGFCVLIDIMNKYLHISVGVSSIIINAALIIISGFIFSFESVIYAIIASLVSSYIVDRVVIGISDNKVFYIVTKKPLEVRDYIIDKLHYSVTIVEAKGGYTHKKKKMLLCVVPTIEYVQLKEVISSIDDEAFFLIVDTYDTSVKKNCKNM